MVKKSRGLISHTILCVVAFHGKNVSTILLCYKTVYQIDLTTFAFLQNCFSYTSFFKTDSIVSTAICFIILPK